MQINYIYYSMLFLQEYECRSIMFITEKRECTKWSLALVEFLRRANQEVPQFLEEEIAKPEMNVSISSY